MSKTRVIISKVQLVNLKDDSRVSILGETVVGRTEGDLNFPEDGLLSRKHLRILPTEEFVLVEDLGSTNRTSINGKKVESNKLHRIRSRDTIEFGQQKFQVIIAGEISDEVKQEQKGHKEDSVVLSSSGLKFEDDLNVMEANSLEDEAFVPELAKLLQNKNTKYFVQFEGSEFGPLVLKELESVIGSQKFKGGALLFWSEGLANWMPVGALVRMLGGNNPNANLTRKLLKSFSLVASVTVFLDAGKTTKLQGTCQSLSLLDIAIAIAEDLSSLKNPISIDVIPLKSSGVERFAAEVNLKSKEFGGYLMEFTKLPDKARAQLEKYARGKGGPQRL